MSEVGPRCRRAGFGCWLYSVISWRRRLVAVVGEEVVEEEPRVVGAGGDLLLGGVAVEEECDLGIVGVRCD